MKIPKKIIALMLTCSMVLLSGITVSAEETNVYEQIVEEYNAIYGISLEYVEVGSRTDIDEYREFIKEVAKNERATLDFIENRVKGRMVLDDFGNIEYSDSVGADGFYDSIASIRSTSVTETKDALSTSFSAPSTCHVTCTYTNYGSRIGNPSNVSVSVDNSITTVNHYILDSWSYCILDLGETIAITTTGTYYYTVRTTGIQYSIGGTTIYTEFYL